MRELTSIDEKSFQLRGRDFSKVDRQSCLKHADAHVGEQFCNQPVLPMCRE